MAWNSAFTNNDLNILAKNVLGLIPGGNYIATSASNSWKNPLNPDNSSLGGYLKAAATDLGNNILNIPHSILSTVASPALSLYEATGGKSLEGKGYDYGQTPFVGGLLSGQQSYQSQHNALQKQGAGEVLSTLMPPASDIATAALMQHMANSVQNTLFGQPPTSPADIAQSPYMQDLAQRAQEFRQAQAIREQTGSPYIQPMINPQNMSTEPIASTPLSAEKIIDLSEGFKPGQRLAFDRALIGKNADILRSMIPSMPQDYVARFSGDIAKILSGK